MRAVEDLVGQVRDPRSRAHFAEAVRAYGAGAYRAAIISAWVTVALDLLSKIRQLAGNGEGAATDHIAKLDKAIATENHVKLQELERSLLDVCRDSFELIDARDYVALKRLYQDRHVCAHPAFVAPEESFEASPELVRAHLATAVDSVLRHGATAGRRAIDRFMTESKGSTWPASQEALVAYLRERYLERGKTGLRRNLAIVVVKGAIDRSLAEPTRRRLVDAAHAIDKIDPNLFSEAADTVIRRREEGPGLDPHELAHMVGSLGDLSPVWSAFPTTSLPRIVALIETIDAEFLERDGVLSTSVREPTIAAAIEARLGTLDDEDLHRVILFRPSAHLVDHALNALANAETVDSADTRMIQLVQPLARFIKAHHLEQVLEILRDNSEVRAAAVTHFLVVRLFDETSARPGNLAVWQRISDLLARTPVGDDLKLIYSAVPALQMKITAAVASGT
ncbi:hypothetical protein ACFO6V_07270 [Promicromonospora alba]|uniref:Uncharacterized protein n=1 Tax=Promicromonospora alba TaxID=1616110 RepID=A0ABV9HEI3_9MICO